MEFFFPADVFTAYPHHQGPSARTTSYRAGPSTNIFSGCGFDSHPFFADSLADAIQHERAAAQARAQAQAQRAARAEAARRAKAAAARRAAEEQRQQAQAYLQHIFEVQQREAQRRFHLEQLRRQRQEEQRRQQYEEYQRRKAYAIEKERQRIAAAKAAAHDQSKQLFLALEDLIFGGLNGFLNAHQQDEDDDEDEQVELAHKNATQHHTAPQPQTQSIDVKGKGKAKEDDNTEHAMEVDNNDDAEDTAAAAAAALMVTDEDPEEVGPVPTSPVTESVPAPVSAPAPVAPKTTEQLLFTHAFPSASNFDKSTVRADTINVSVDEAQRKVTVSGLWNDQPTAPASPARAASPTPSDSSSRRGRSRSPKRARVSDVDENGDEIVTPDADADANDDDFVEVSFTRAPPAEQQKTVEKTFDLPHGANIEDLRAELTDEGLKLFTTVTA
ncbi:uncharacterized protein UTRI_00112_B [Ustilago trichophora]|uniref:Uncharacterized protein n=1 Tax=Ustilago trichophora TaxID=86804 RepID=A0A5C3DR87_9BASI|nr:uncharacterized protein UTRI_00112_B [Ustilago trichophora]